MASQKRKGNPQLQVRLPRDHWIWEIDPKMRSLEVQKALDFYRRYMTHGKKCGLRSLSRAGHEILYITSRPVLAINFTREWLKAWGFPCGGIVFAPMGFKKVVAAACGIDVSFEDDPWEAVGLQEVVTQVYMPAWPYNKNVTGHCIQKFTFWEEILNCLDCHLQNRMVL